MLSRALKSLPRATKAPTLARTFVSSARVFSAPTKTDAPKASNLAEVTGPESLFGPGAEPGTIPTDWDQATGLERLELLGKMEGVDVFDMENPIFEGSGTMQDPYLVPTYIGYRYVGCMGKKGEEHKPYWLKVTTEEPARCWHSGVVFLAKYVGRPEHHH